MKKILALVLVLSMVLGSFGFAFAATPAQTNAGQMLKDLGVLKGDAQGDLMLDSVLKRQDIIVLLSRLMGAEEEASKFPIPTAFTDVTDAYYKPFIGWAQVEGLTNGIGENKFGFDQELTVKELATMLLRALGHEGAHAWDNAEKLAVELGLVATGANFAGAASRAVMAEATLGALKAPTTTDSKQSLGTKLGFTGFELVEDFAVKSVKANTAKSFQVEFTSPAEDTSKVNFTVKRGTTTTTLTTKWNEAKTVATLEAAAKLAEGIYTIKVGDLAEEKVEITKEKVVAVEFDADTLVRINDEYGVAGYVVKNQYGENITDTALGRGLTWLSSTNQSVARDSKAGVITVGHTGAALNQLKDLKTVVVTVRDTTTGFVATKSFGISDTVSIVNDVKLLGIVDENGKEAAFTYDATKTYFLDYEAYDVNGKQVTYYGALTALVNGTNVLDVNSSNTSVVTVTPERHPQDSSKLVYRLTLGAAITYDTPVTFIAVAPFTGKSSTLTATLTRSARVENFALQAPAETVSINKAVEIPFTAQDQNGEEITRYEDLNGFINITAPAGSTVGFVRQADGSAKLFGTFTADQLHYITATVNGSLRGSFSQISIDVKELAVPTRIEALRHTRAYTTGGAWSSRRINNITIRDQYDRTMNLRTDASATAYSVRVTTSNSAVVAVNGGTTATISGDATVAFQGGATFGTATITYELMNGATVVDTASTIVYNVDPADIRSAKIVADHTQDLYMVQGSTTYYTAGARTTVGNNMNNAFTMVGLLNSGMEVRLPASMVNSYTTTDSRFTMSGGTIYADGSFGNDTTATTTVTGYVYGRDGILSASTTVKASSVAPAPKAITVSYSNPLRRSGVIAVDNDIVDVTLANFTAQFNGRTIFGVRPNGTAAVQTLSNGVYVSGPAGIDAAPFRFFVNTQLGQDESGVLERVIVTRTSGTGTLLVDGTTGVVNTSGVAANDQYTLTAIAANGMTKTVVVRVLP